jgi:RecJ-like exonuclease
VLDVTVHDGGDTSKIELTCITCDGHGKVTAPKMRAFYAMKAAWCRCDEVGDNVRYYDDGQHPDCTKHHWRHEPGCGLIVQVG